MRKLANACEEIAATTKKLLKISIVANYLKSRSTDEAAISAVFLSGRAFPAWEETMLQVGGRSLWQVVADLAGKSEHDLTAAYRKHGDLGAVAGDLLPERTGQGLNILEVEAAFRQVATARGSTSRNSLIRDLLARSSPLEAKYIVKIITGDLRIGLKESLVEEAIARAYGGASTSTLKEVQRGNMLLGDIAQTVRLAAAGKLVEAKMRLFHPLGFMLASPIDAPEDGLSYFAEAAVEDKYDGIRAQAHISGGVVKFFSRTRDEITESFPELPDALAGLAQDAILDGEIVAWEYPSKVTATRQIANASADQSSHSATESFTDNLGRARPFSVLQQRLGRKKVSETMLREIPVAFLVFDILYAGGELLIDRPLRERARMLDALRAAPRHTVAAKSTRAAQGQLAFADEKSSQDATNRIIRAPVFRASSPDELEQLFTAAQSRGNEGLMIKDLNSPYTPGKRGRWWLKMKRELGTLDVVVTAVEYGHGKRIDVLSDYTFAVWETDSDGNQKLANIGKAYSGLTDVEIAEMTKWFLDHTIRDEGFRLVVEPRIVLEVAFNNMMRSKRHESGYALRFPRIVRLRPDKSAENADTLERAKEIYQRQEI